MRGQDTSYETDIFTDFTGFTNFRSFILLFGLAIPELPEDLSLLAQLRHQLAAYTIHSFQAMPSRTWPCMRGQDTSYET